MMVPWGKKAQKDSRGRLSSAYYVQGPVLSTS